jgi:hypothetical protein
VDNFRKLIEVERSEMVHKFGNRFAMNLTWTSEAVELVDNNLVVEELIQGICR